MSYILDASAVLALLNGEPGADTVADLLPESAMSVVNAMEVASKLVDGGMTSEAAWRALGLLNLRLIDFNLSGARAAVDLRAATVSAGLSLGDRACLAQAVLDFATAVTADRAWARLEISCPVEMIR